VAAGKDRPANKADHVQEALELPRIRGRKEKRMDRENMLEEIADILKNLDDTRLSRVLRYCELHYLEAWEQKKHAAPDGSAKRKTA